MTVEVAQDDDAALAQLMRRVLADEEVFVQVEMRWLTLDGGLDLSPAEVELVERHRKRF